MLALSMTAGSLMHRDGAIMPVDHVASMAAATSLGSDLFRSRDDRHAMRRAAIKLAALAYRRGRKTGLTLSRDQSVRFAVAAICERIRPQCRRCTGAGVVVVADLKIVCPTCDGSTIHRYRDRERAKMCGIPVDQWPALESRYEMVMAILLRHDTAPYLASVRLGRD